METIADKSRTKEIIERLQSIIDGASPVPLASGKVMIYKDEVQSLLTELTASINMEIKTYHEVNDRRGKIINEAKKEAERIIYQAEHTASRMRVNRRTTNVDPVDFSMLSQNELDELDNANEIYGASLIYTDEMLTEVSNLINDTYQNIKNDYEIILNVMEEKISTLAANRKELMEGLSDMDAKDRSQQIIEIGQLLSDELFNARVNGRRNPDMYDDGSVQLSFDLKTEHEIRAEEAEAAALEAMNNARQKELEAKEAIATAEEAEKELAKMKAERDKLREEMSFLKSLREKAALKNEKNRVATRVDDTEADDVSEEETEDVAADNVDAQAGVEAAAADGMSEAETEDVVADNVDAQAGAEAAAADSVSEADADTENAGADNENDEDDEEYEIVYVTEDELEEGEEYEIEYVDDYDEELGDGAEPATEKTDVEAAESTKEVESTEEAESTEEVESTEEADDTELEKAEEGLGTVPMIPHFTKSEKIVSVPSEKVVKMANAITTDKKYSGLISRAVAEREKKEVDDVITVEKPEFEITEF